MNTKSIFFPLVSVFFLGFAFAACDPYENYRQEAAAPTHVEVTVTLHDEGGASSQALGTSSAGQIGSSLIYAVNQGTQPPENFQDFAAADFHDMAPLDLATSSVTLTLPFDQYLQLVEYTFNDTMTLAEILAGAPVAGRPQVSSAFQLTPSTERVAVSLSFPFAGFNPDFTVQALNSQIWEDGLAVRKITGTYAGLPLRVGVQGQDRSLANDLVPRNLAGFTPADLNGIATMAANVFVEPSSVTASGTTKPRAGLAGRFYHTTTEGEAAANALGDVYGEIYSDGSNVSYLVGICGDEACSEAKLTAITTGGTAAVMGAAATAASSPDALSISWDAATSKFTFAHGATTQVFDPVAAGAPVSGATPNRPFKAVGGRAKLANGGKGGLTAYFGPVTFNGATYDDFTAPGVRPDLWDVGAQQLEMAAGLLTLTASTTFSGSAALDTAGVTSQARSNRNRQLNTHRITGVLTLANPTLSGSAARVGTHPELRYQPRANRAAGKTGLAFVRIAIEKAGVVPLAAKLVGEICADAACTTTTAGSYGTGGQAFPVDSLLGARAFSLEYQGSGVFKAVLDGYARTVDLSAVSGWNEADFVNAALVAKADGMTGSGDTAFIAAAYGPVEIGAGPQDLVPPGRVNFPLSTGNPVAADSGASLLFEWVIPQDDSFSGVRILRSSAQVTGPNDQAATIVLKDEPATCFTDADLPDGTQFFYAVFAADAAGNFSVARDLGPITTIVLPPPQSDATPPALVSNLTATANSSTGVTLSWKNPRDAPNCDFVGVQIARQTTGFPTGPSDYDGAFSPPFPAVNAATFTDGSAVAGTTYYYALFSEDNTGTVNATGSQVTVTVPQ